MDVITFLLSLHLAKKYAIESDGLIEIDTSASQQTVDGSLYALISEFGWVSEVIS